MSLEKCKACSDYFKWDDDVIQVDNDYYHRDCVTLYPTGYCAFLYEDCLGETENDDGDMAFNLLSKGTYIDLDEEEVE
ncbi:hypothetical protein ACPTFN_12935 [Enterococcus faecalis]|uniref:hypothetical protein n=1 Tax=Enterococcus faecalis TaxID=1351 RepID=UPI003B7E25EB